AVSGPASLTGAGNRALRRSGARAVVAAMPWSGRVAARALWQNAGPDPSAAAEPRNRFTSEEETWVHLTAGWRWGPAPGGSGESDAPARWASQSWARTWSSRAPGAIRRRTRRTRRSLDGGTSRARPRRSASAGGGRSHGRET